MAAARHVSTVPKEDQSQVINEVKEESEQQGKKKIHAKDVRKKTDRKKSKKETKQGVIRPVKERETEQKDMVCREFLASKYGVESVPTEIDDVVGEFWDHLMAANRLYIFK